ncbi:hypothetical protein, partial [Escherichia coli]
DVYKRQVFWFAMVMIIATLFCLLRIKDV